MFSFFRKAHVDASHLLTSRLYNNDTFYKEFIHDLNKSKREVLIESPFITTKRVEPLLPVLKKAIKRGVKIVVTTRDPNEHNTPYDAFAVDAIAELQSIGVRVICIGKHHRKIAIFDRTILWEGSLNILSQYDSCEIMRRTHSQDLAQQMIQFIKLGKFFR